MKNLFKSNITVNIAGNDYTVKELTLAQKNKLIAPIGEFIRKLAAHAFFKKNNDGGIRFFFVDEVSLAELDIDKIILSSIDITSQLLTLAIPDFSDWDNLPESMSREALIKACEVQDFKGYIANFFSLATNLIR